MTAQASLFDHPGMGEAASHALPADLASVRLHAEALARLGIPFSADDVRAKLSDAQQARMDAFPSAMGGVYFQMARQGLLEGVGYAPSVRPEARGRPIRVWRGLTHGEPR